MKVFKVRQMDLKGIQSHQNIPRSKGLKLEPIFNKITERLQLLDKCRRDTFLPLGENKETIGRINSSRYRISQIQRRKSAITNRSIEHNICQVGELTHNLHNILKQDFEGVVNNELENKPKHSGTIRNKPNYNKTPNELYNYRRILGKI